MSEQPPTAVELADSILRTLDAVNANGDAVRRFAEETESEVARLWEAIAELRDDQHEGLSALSNRLQNLTTAVTTAPAEVAQRMVPLPYPVCECGHRYDHHDHHGDAGCHRCECVGYIGKAS